MIKKTLIIASILILGFAFSESFGLTKFNDWFVQKNALTPSRMPQEEEKKTDHNFKGYVNSESTQTVRIEDMIFKVKRMETKTYLRLKGLSEFQMNEAIETGVEEDVFYFDFQDLRKQDLFKKYHQTKMDAAVSYMAFEIDKDFVVVTDQNDTLTPSFSMFERNFHTAPYERIILGFSKLDHVQNYRLIYHDRLFDKGVIEFEFQNDFNQFLISENV